jgi:hypothetical protein
MKGHGEALSIWTVYDHPRDYPNSWVARRFEISNKGVGITREMFLADTLEELRVLLPVGLVRLNRQASDDPKIVETWL